MAVFVMLLLETLSDVIPKKTVLTRNSSAPDIQSQLLSALMSSHSSKSYRKS